MNLTDTITDELLPTFEGAIPALIASCSADGIPNVTYISQVFYVDDHHLALSRQFFNKTIRNISENPVACVVVTCPRTFNSYKLIMEYRESQTEGEIFNNMAIQLEVIAGLQNQADNFRLLSADIYRIKSIEPIYRVIK